MSVTRGFRSLLPLVVVSLVSLHSSVAHAADQSSATPGVSDQIVRVNYVEGDVRVSRGAEGEKVSGSPWQKAVVNLPLYEGFNLVTGEGRAVVEFEDASTVYLAPNSVLAFHTLNAVNGIPHTSIALLSGTMTTNIVPEFRDETYELKTPSEALTVHYPQRAYVRIDSFLDAMRVTPMGKDLVYRQAGSLQRVENRQPLLLSHGQIVSNGTNMGLPQNDGTVDATWNAWVKAQVETRNTALKAAMKDAGLSQPIPGLAEMEGQGKFFDCDEGRCWEPTNSAPQSKTNVPNNSTEATSHARAGFMLAAYALQSAQMPLPGYYVDDDPYFPCNPYEVRSWYEPDAKTGRMRLVNTQVINVRPAYEWAVCHAGEWAYHRQHYVWAPGPKRHHRCPVRWVQNGKTSGYVPLHPKDEVGKPPLNLQHGVYETRDWKQRRVELVAYDQSKPVKILTAPPKQFAQPVFMPLAKADAPRLEARNLQMRPATSEPGRKGDTLAQKPGVEMSFDHKTQTFSIQHEMMQGGKTTTVSTPLGGGTNSSHIGSSGVAAYRGSSGASGMSHSSGGTSSGGAPHASAGGGGSFSGGGGSSPRASTSAPTSHH